MKIKRIHIALCALILVSPMYGQTENTTLATMITQPSSKKSKNATIYFHFDNEDIVDIVNMLAAQKNVNVILPMGNNEIKIKVTLFIEKALTLEQAWDILHTILDISGYSLLPHGDMYIIVKNSKLIAKEATPLYIATPLEQLPNTDQRIRYLYYFSNIKASNDPNKDVILQTLKDILPETAVYNIDPVTNALLVTDKANNIISAMNIVTALDQTTFKEEIEIVQLHFTSADVVAKLFSENILKSANETHRYNVKGRDRSEEMFFSSNVRLIPEMRTNKLVILGKKQAIGRVKDFILKYIDIELGSGRSILHVYDLLYLDAAEFAPVLESIVRSQIDQGPAQALGGAPAQGLDRFFDGVLIKSAYSKGQESQFSSNKLIIAAKTEDWLYIKKLIEELDTPQPQVILEVLIADLTINDIRQLGSIARNPANLAFKSGTGVSLQSGQVAPLVLDPPTPPTVGTTLQSDLLWQNGTNPASNDFSQLLNTGAGGMGEVGSTVISLNDPSTGKTWSALQMLQSFGRVKILSHPHVIASNNKKASISIGEERLLRDEATASSGGQTINFKKINATLQVTLTPRISSAKHVNLQIDIDISDFVDTGVTAEANNTQIKRRIRTNASVQSNDVLALGGLIRTAEANGFQGTPILSKIPILGWLFKRRRKTEDKTDLTVFISATVVLPRQRGGVGQYTKDYVQMAQRYSSEAELFDGLRDPITRFFFSSKINLEDEVNQFLDNDPELYKALATGEQKPNEYPTPIEPPARVVPTITTPAPATNAPQVVTQKEAAPQMPSTPIVVATSVKHASEKSMDPLQALLAQEENPFMKGKAQVASGA